MIPFGSKTSITCSKKKGSVQGVCRPSISDYGCSGADDCSQLWPVESGQRHHSISSFFPRSWRSINGRLSYPILSKVHAHQARVPVHPDVYICSMPQMYFLGTAQRIHRRQQTGKPFRPTSGVGAGCWHPALLVAQTAVMAPDASFTRIARCRNMHSQPCACIGQATTEALHEASALSSGGWPESKKIHAAGNSRSVFSWRLLSLFEGPCRDVVFGQSALMLAQPHPLPRCQRDETTRTTWNASEGRFRATGAQIQGRCVVRADDCSKGW